MPDKNVPSLESMAPPRKRGRPVRTFAQTELVRSQIKDAAIQVFADRGDLMVSVELILQASGLSRPTFYRYFSNVREVVEEVLKEKNDLLIEMVITAVRKAEGPLQKLDAGLLAWRQWGEQTGPIVRAILTEVHNPESPAASERRRVFDVLAAEFNAITVALNRKSLDACRLEAFMTGIEFLGFRYHFGPEPPSEASWQLTRQAMLRLALGLLGGAFEWAHAVQVAAVLGIDLD